MARKPDADRGSRVARKSIKTLVYCYFIPLLSISLLPLAAGNGAWGSEKWPGVDETVIEKVAREHGRASRDPLINTDQGDMLLFLFLLAGAAGGFMAGYYWRRLMEGKGK